jgi:DNA (cytosine-5)-methyltransferase 1
MILLDTFCGAGGAAMGYHRAGFEVVGVDIAPQPHYPFEFHQADALDFIADHGHEFDVIHASPPCQAYSRTKSLPNTKQHPTLIEPTRQALKTTGRPYIIENVPGAPLHNPVTLCGLAFSLQVFRHRLFETSPWILGLPHPNHDGYTTGTHRYPYGGNMYEVCGRGGGKGSHDQWSHAMGINWMTNRELTQAIPPAYTQWIGEQLIYILHNSQFAIRNSEAPYDR